MSDCLFLFCLSWSTSLCPTSNRSNIVAFLPLPAQIPSCAVVLLGSSSEEALARVYGAPIVVQVPFPDQSMPFNVIAFTLTAVAFFAGSLLNISTARTQDIVRRLMARSDETKKNVVASVNGEAADLTKAEQLALHSEQ